MVGRTTGAGDDVFSVGVAVVVLLRRRVFGVVNTAVPSIFLRFELGVVFGVGVDVATGAGVEEFIVGVAVVVLLRRRVFGVVNTAAAVVFVRFGVGVVFRVGVLVPKGSSDVSKLRSLSQFNCLSKLFGTNLVLHFFSDLLVAGSERKPRGFSLVPIPPTTLGGNVGDLKHTTGRLLFFKI